MEAVDNRTNQPVSKRTAFLRIMRYVSVFAVTIWLFVLLSASLSTNEWHLITWMVLTAFFFFIAIPVLGFWIYSFIKAVITRTKTDNILLFFHIADLLLLGTAIYLVNHRDCNANIMAEHYEMDGDWMRNIAKYDRLMLPDSTQLVIEFGEDEYIPQADYLNEIFLKILRNHLEDVGCIGMEIDNHQLKDYTKFRFRRVGMGMYSFRLYNNPLTLEQQDSINANECLIVYNDSTVFEFSGGVLGVQHFVGKQEFLDKRNKRLSTTDTIAAIERITNFEPGYNILPIIDSISYNKLRICPESDISQIPDSVAYLRYVYASGKTRQEGWVAYFDDPENDFSNPFGEWRYYDEQGNCYQKFWKYKKNKQ